MFLISLTIYYIYFYIICLLQPTNQSFTQSQVGLTPLYWAALRGYIDVCQYLISAGADIDKADIEGKKPLAVAENNEIRSLLSNPEEIQRLRSQPYQRQVNSNIYYNY